MRRLILLLWVIGLSSTFADEWKVPLKGSKRPNNNPGNPSVKVSGQLDFLGFKMKLGDQQQVGIRVRNAKHKRGPRSITVNLGNSNLVVQRVDILKPISKIEAMGDGEHLMESFLFQGKTFEIFNKVTNGKIENQLIVRQKK